MVMDDRVTLITGTGRGVGAGVASVLAAESGKLVVCDLDPAACEASAEQARAAGAEVVAMVCDVSDEEQVEALFATAHAAFGRLDVLVNTVAWIDPPGPIVDLPRWVSRASSTWSRDVDRPCCRPTGRPSTWPPLRCTW
jgi:NAD(P)-dependent dehydrogenase (short-subunit alcohol dehydrogenase family)